MARRVRTFLDRPARSAAPGKRALQAISKRAATKKSTRSQASSIAKRQVNARKAVTGSAKSNSTNVKTAYTTAKTTAMSLPGRTTKKAITKAPKPVLADEEKLRIKEEREQKKAERLRIKEEKDKIKAEKERIKAEKLKMWELHPNKAIPEFKSNLFNTSLKGKQRVLPGKGCCIFCNNREALQCAYARDAQCLKQVFADVNNISNPFQQFGIDCDDGLIK